MGELRFCVQQKCKTQKSQAKNSSNHLSHQIKDTLISVGDCYKFQNDQFPEYAIVTGFKYSTNRLPEPDVTFSPIHLYVHFQNCVQVSCSRAQAFVMKYGRRLNDIQKESVTFSQNTGFLDCNSCSQPLKCFYSAIAECVVCTNMSFYKIVFVD